MSKPAFLLLTNVIMRQFYVKAYKGSYMTVGGIMKNISQTCYLPGWYIVQEANWMLNFDPLRLHSKKSITPFEISHKTERKESCVIRVCSTY